MCCAEVVKISLKVAECDFGKTSQGNEKSRKGKRRRYGGKIKGDLGKYRIEKKARQEMVRMGLG